MLCLLKTVNTEGNLKKLVLNQATYVNSGKHKSICENVVEQW